MKDIVVFKKTEELHKYDLWITFDKQEELDDWLRTTLENKDSLLIMQQYRRRNLKHFKCEKCNEISSADDINNATKKYFGEDIEPITGDKWDGDYMCPKCNALVCGECFKEID